MTAGTLCNRDDDNDEDDDASDRENCHQHSWESRT